MNYFWAFVTGGAICVVGQLFLDLTPLTPARILTGYVVAGVVLSALGWYAPLAEFAGCGATAVPYTPLRAHETVLGLVCRLLLEKKEMIEDGMGCDMPEESEEEARAEASKELTSMTTS